MSDLLKEKLGDFYSGPSISFYDDHFVLYSRDKKSGSCKILVKEKDWAKFLYKVLKT